MSADAVQHIRQRQAAVVEASRHDPVELRVEVAPAVGEVAREHDLMIGQERHGEIVGGLDAGETIAVTNTFVLKAELEKRVLEGDEP